MGAAGTRPLRIAVLLDRLEVGGVEKVAIQQVRALRDLGHDATLAVLRRRGDGLHAFADELREIPVQILEDRLPAPLRRSAAVPGFAFLQTFHFTYPPFAHLLVRPGEFERILCHGSYTFLAASAVGRVRQVPVALFLWDPTYHVLASDAYAGRAVGRLGGVLLPLARRFDSWLVQRPALVLLGGSAYEPYVRALAPRRVVVSPPGAVPATEIVPADARAPEMLAVTAWKAGKAPERLLDVLERQSHLRLVVAGAWLDTRLHDAFLREIQCRGLAARVEVTGALAEAALRDRYRRSLFVVQTWSSRGFGLSPLEAAAEGTTFVVPRDQGSTETFRDGVDGLFFDLDSDDQLAAAVDRLAASTSFAAELGRNAWAHVRARHSWASRAAELATELESLRPHVTHEPPGLQG
jgi:glycosyltransferase involved in cell wall biosynthesis